MTCGRRDCVCVGNEIGKLRKRIKILEQAISVRNRIIEEHASFINDIVRRNDDAIRIHNSYLESKRLENLAHDEMVDRVNMLFLD